MNLPAALPRIVGAKLPLRPMHVWTIRVRLQIERRVRDLALFDIALDSKLRGCDVVALRLADIMAAGSLRRCATVIQQKTGRPVQFEITEQTRRTLANWLNHRPESPEQWLFPSRMRPGAHLSARQYIRLVKRWVTLVGVEPAAYGSHSLRRTKCRCSIGRPATQELASSCSGTPSLKAPCAILVWSWTMPLRFPKGWKSKHRITNPLARRTKRLRTWFTSRSGSFVEASEAIFQTETRAKSTKPPGRSPRSLPRGWRIIRLLDRHVTVGVIPQGAGAIRHSGSFGWKADASLQP
jgi:hypothetical protein